MRSLSSIIPKSLMILFFFCSFGWLYLSNTGVFLQTRITPSTPVSFRQKSCSSACNPDKYQYENNPYLVLGTRRQSTDEREQFQLDMPFDFIGVPTQSRFCGNTILVNTGTYHRVMKTFPSGFFKGTPFNHRGFDIDTTSPPPRYNDLDMINWYRRRSKRGSVSRKNKDSPSDNCQPESDRIMIEELEIINDSINDRAIVYTGDEDDVLTIPAWILIPSTQRADVLLADLGSGTNLLSLGSAISMNRERSKLVGGVAFDNSQGRGKVCYLMRDLITTRCVGYVRGVKVY